MYCGMKFIRNGDKELRVVCPGNAGLGKHSNTELTTLQLTGLISMTKLLNASLIRSTFAGLDEVPNILLVQPYLYS